MPGHSTDQVWGIKQFTGAKEVRRRPESRLGFRIRMTSAPREQISIGSLHSGAPVMSPALELHLPKGKVVIRGPMTMPLLRQVIEAMQ